MKNMAFTSFFFMLLASVSVEAAEKERSIYVADGPWVLEYADSACRLMRNLSNGESTVTLAFERFEIGPAMRLGITGNSLSAWSNARKSKFRYLPSGTEREAALQRTELSGGQTAFLIVSGSLISPERGKEITDNWQGADSMAQFNSEEVEAGTRNTALLISEGFKDEIELRLGSLDEPVKALQACANDLVRSWGLDPQKIVSMSRFPEPVESPQRWLNGSDYPGDIFREGRSAAFRIRLILSAEGAVEDCKFEIEVPEAFEKVACERLTQRARFHPALDADGKPMRTYWRQSIHFTP